MTDFRALCEELVETLDYWLKHSNLDYFDPTDSDARELANRARAALAEQPVRPTLMERAMAGDATAAKQFLYKAGFTDEHGQWLPHYQPISEITND